jgi:hypothetical protein
MKKVVVTLSLCLLLLSFLGATAEAAKVAIGPRVSGNFNIYNSKGLTGTWNGIGVGIGGTIDVSFSEHIGIMGNLTAFDMRNFSNSTTQGNATLETNLSLAYLTIDPMFKAEFSGFYMVSGPSIGIKLNSSGEQTQTVSGVAPQVQAISPETKSLRFDIAVGAGYTFNLSPGMALGTDFMAYIPITDTYNFPGVSNSIFTLKLGAALKFKM